LATRSSRRRRPRARRPPPNATQSAPSGPSYLLLLAGEGTLRLQILFPFLPPSVEPAILVSVGPGGPILGLCTCAHTIHVAQPPSWVCSVVALTLLGTGKKNLLALPYRGYSYMPLIIASRPRIFVCTPRELQQRTALQATLLLPAFSRAETAVQLLHAHPARGRSV
jgi:hypothetical protein